MTVAPGSAVPVTSTPAPFSMLLRVLSPPIGFTPTLGPTVSTTTFNAALVRLMLPARSSLIAVNACAPSSRAAVVNVQRPAASVIPVPTCTNPAYNFTVLPASALPETIKTLFFVKPSVASMPVSVVKPLTRGAKGDVVSICTLSVAPEALTLPATSVNCARKVCAPAARFEL